MPKDFAKKKSPRKNSGASRQNKKKSTPFGLWFLVIVIVAAFISGLVYLKWFRTDSAIKGDAGLQTNAPLKTQNPKKTSDSQPTTGSVKPKQTSKEQTNSLENIEEAIPLYDVHEDLTNKEVIISEEDLTLPGNINKYTYTMPCGSFREDYRAEELKAQIAMTGNKSTIAAVKYKGETWYRVQLGPFNKKRTAESIRHRLQDNNIYGCIIHSHLVKE